MNFEFREKKYAGKVYLKLNLAQSTKQEALNFLCADMFPNDDFEIMYISSLSVRTTRKDITLASSMSVLEE